MSLPILYFDGTYHVSLSLPGVPSQITKAIGVTSSSSFLTPNLDYIINFSKGELGIGDKIKQQMVTKNINDCDSIDQLKIMARSLNVNIPDNVDKFRKPNGKYSFPQSDVKIDNSKDLGGVKALERTIIKSILETQKPWMEVAGLAVSMVAKVEDIVARSAALTFIPSEKPNTNKGGGDRPKALGYNGATELKDALGKLNSLSKKPSISPTGGTNSNNKIPLTNKDPLTSGYEYQVVSTVYSTGEFDPSVDYEYEYIDIKEESDPILDKSFDLNLDTNSLLPTNVIFGIFNSKGEPIGPEEYIKTFQISQNGDITYGNYIDVSLDQGVQGIQKADWVVKSGKWFGSFERMGIVYTWRSRLTGEIKYSSINPGEESSPTTAALWDIQKYTDDKRKDQPILYFTNDQKSDYISLFTNIIDSKFSQTNDLTPDEKVKYKETILSQVDIQQHLENITQYGFIKSLIDNGIVTNDGQEFVLPSSLSGSFKPKKIRFKEKDVWLDPESDYAMKLIKVDSNSKIKIKDVLNKPETEVDILRFVKNTITIEISDKELFDIEIYKTNSGESPVILSTTEVPGRYNSINQFTFDNWNYEGSLTNQSINQGNSYRIKVSRNIPGPFFINKTYDSWKVSNITIEVVKENQNWIYREYTISNKIKSYRSVENGIKTLIDKSIVNVKDGTIIEWIIFNRDFNFGTIINNTRLFPSNNKKSSVVIDYNTIGNNFDTPDLNISISDIDPNQIRIKENNNPFTKVLDPRKITNDHLVTDKLYSNGMYGQSYKTKKQKIDQIFRYMKSEYDTETYYIIEGVLSNQNIQKDSNGNNPTGTQTEYYTIIDALGSIAVFISMLTDIFSKLIPSINRLVSLLQNPSSFVTGIIIDKVGENFQMFSPTFTNKFSQMSALDPSKRKEFVNGSVLQNHVFVDDKGDYKFLLDGAALTKLSLFGASVNFGIDVTKLNPKLIFGIDYPKISDKTLQSFLNKDKLNVPKDDVNVNLNQDDSAKNQIKTTLDGKDVVDEVSIQYSTGVFIKGVNYEYIYITEYVNKLIKEASDLENKGDIDNLRKAIGLYQEAQKSDPENKFLQDKIKDLVDKGSAYSQPIMDFMLNMTTMPLKIISEVLKVVQNTFMNLNLLELPVKIAEFLSFSWLSKILSPTALLKFAGILNFNPGKLTEWTTSINSYPKDHLFDLTEVIDIAFMPKLFSIGNPSLSSPKVTKDQLLALVKQNPGTKYAGILSSFPLELIKSIVCLIENIVNSFLDLFWSILGLEAIIPTPPYLKLCKDLNSNLSPSSIMGLLNGGYLDNVNGKGEYQFAYDILLPNGQNVRDLNRVELQKWVDEHGDFEFEFKFNENI